MPRPRNVYRGKGKYGWIITLAVTLLVVALLAVIWLFYYLQRFIVYDKDTLHLELPGERSVLVDAGPAPEGPAVTFTPVAVEIVVDPVDYSDLETLAGEDLSTIHARFLGFDELTQTRIDGLAAGMGDFDALVLELKGSAGMLRYQSALPIAASYGVNGTLSLADATEKLKEQEVYLVARISALADTTLSTRYGPIAMKNSNGSGVFVQNGVGWLDPYSDVVRAYLKDLMTELKQLGFDEILFTGLALPDSPLLDYSGSMTGKPDVVSAISSLSVWLRTQADEIGIRISAQAATAPLLQMQSATVGQDLELWFKVFDRVAFECSPDDQAAALTALRNVRGEQDSRLLPIAITGIPGLNNWAIKSS